MSAMHMLKFYAMKLFEEADIMRLLDEKKSRNNMGLKEDTFMLAKQKVIDTLRNSLEKRALINGKEYKCPDTRAESYKPVLCCVRQWIYGHIFSVATSSAVFLGLMKFLWGVRHKKNLSARAEQLYEQVCEILEENALTTKSMNQDGEPWVVASWLRDHLLLPRERRDAKLWKKVEELLLEDSRIDQYPKLVKGESKVVLEWQVDSSLSSKMRQKRALSKTKPEKHVDISSSYQKRESTVNASLNS
ncbi:uncharacterized protein A4U43_C10F3270 [Asparagus officinalis]|uniref:Man1/Src1-like C-terminal domain-containing protein n=1 Tax=Asparagus officinalis TaxID=4686 RepID=A0A5P1E4R5_ASPOF|nr:uncharacterized protein A4U43_C10F3270 [Asparagus officinalis]